MSGKRKHRSAYYFMQCVIGDDKAGEIIWKQIYSSKAKPVSNNVVTFWEHHHTVTC